MLVWSSTPILLWSTFALSLYHAGQASTGTKSLPLLCEQSVPVKAPCPGSMQLHLLHSMLVLDWHYSVCCPARQPLATCSAVLLKQLEPLWLAVEVCCVQGGAASKASHQLILL